MRRIGAAALALAAALLLSGCGSLAPRSSYTPTITVAPTSAPTSTMPTGSSTTVTFTLDPSATPTPAASDPGRPPGQCPDDVLGVDIRRSADGGAAGSLHYDLLFVNTGGEPCALSGAPGVSVVRDGKRIGPSATRDDADARTVTLGSGGTAVAVLRVTDIGDGGGPLGAACSVRDGDGYRVYAPHSTKRFAVPEAHAVACAEGPVFMSVGPVRSQ